MSSRSSFFCPSNPYVSLLEATCDSHCRSRSRSAPKPLKALNNTTCLPSGKASSKGQPTKKTKKKKPIHWSRRPHSTCNAHVACRDPLYWLRVQGVKSKEQAQCTEVGHPRLSLGPCVVCGVTHCRRLALILSPPRACCSRQVSRQFEDHSIGLHRSPRPHPAAAGTGDHRGHGCSGHCRNGKCRDSLASAALAGMPRADRRPTTAAGKRGGPGCQLGLQASSFHMAIYVQSASPAQI